MKNQLLAGGRMVLPQVFLSLLWLGSGQSVLGSQPNQKQLQNAGFALCDMQPSGYYNGSLTTTFSGSVCLNWSDFPDYIQQYPNRGLGNHNYCRNPDGGPNPWCFYQLISGATGWANCDCSQDSVRLTESGRVEIYYKGLWGMICDDEWTDLDASVVCQQLGLSETGTALRQRPSSSELLPLHLQSANCRGDEKMLSQCSYQEIFRACIQGTAGATCGSSQAVGSPLRLVGGTKSFEGRVEIYHDGHWGTICDDQWDDKDAEVVCRHLDLSGFSRAVSWAHFGKGSGSILLDEVECSGNELSLDQCKKSDWGKHNCDHIEDAGVICDPFVAEGTIRLTGGLHPSEGRVEIYHNGRWGCICDDGWKTGINAQVACRQLGFNGPARLASKDEFAPGQGFILLDDVACIGTESSLMDCPHSNWGQHDCSHEEDVGICCSLVGNRITEDKTGNFSSPGRWQGLLVRLVDGDQANEGHVELFLNGEWGRICAEGWTERAAAVVCRQLGYSGTAVAIHRPYSDAWHGPIHLDNVECSGTEHTLAECIIHQSGQHNCRQKKSARVICDYMRKERQFIRNDGSNIGLCGLRLTQHRNKRIIGGNKSSRGSWPWQVSLRLKGIHKDARLLCGATLISSCWVMTAAHCFKRFGVDVRRYLLRVGDHHTAVRDESERELPVEKILLHRNYRSSSNDNDIALVRMWGKEDNCLSFSHRVFPVCLPAGKQKAAVDRKSCIISGWGDTGRSYSRMLLQGIVPLLPRNVCKSRYGKKFTNRMLCAGNLSADNRVDSCQGDSGGPLVCQRPNTQWVILGITSWGYGCGQKDSPGVYTKVSKFVPWIKKVTKII
ncbi:neurotrypsin-like [Pituophis catenifer annectens]|uniref:neurotrypsin-like n=1 Tax=Pituophis catenifer annectens TaxID=94852 RepID=UPI0039919A5C